MKTIFTFLLAFIANFTLQAKPLIDGQDSVSQATVQADSVPQATVQADFVSLPPDSTAPVPGASASGSPRLLISRLPSLARQREGKARGHPLHLSPPLHLEYGPYGI